MKFVILGIQRTGTTLLRTHLNNHPDVVCRDELFLKKYVKADGFRYFCNESIWRKINSRLFPRKAVSEFINRVFSGKSFAEGFKLMLNQYRERKHIWQELLNHEIKVLLVNRRNVLKTLVSRLMARKSGVFHIVEKDDSQEASQKAPRIKLEIDTGTLLDCLNSIRDDFLVCQQLVRESRVDFLEVVFEEFTENRSEVSQQIQEFLEIEPHSLSSPLKKVNSDNLQDLISNFSCVERTLSNTPYAKCLT